LVTPFSQYVKNVALMNVIQLEKGGERWSMVADNIWDMVLGKSGHLPGKVGDEILAIAKKEGREFYSGHPQTPYADALDTFRAEMDKNGWDYGKDDEELFELAMHPEQYRMYKSGEAKENFNKEIAELKAKKQDASEPTGSAMPANWKPSTMNVNVNGENFVVTVSYDGTQAASAATAAPAPAAPTGTGAAGEPVVAPLEGKFYFTKDSSETAIKVGDKVKAGDLVGYIEAMKTYNAVRFDRDGVVQKIVAANSADVEEDDVLVYMQ
jgi:pyruvate carboxylase subunit B